ncbi:hypothetical protein [Streptomyces sp. 3211.6]|uniref:hypothetical protein n=1 Tax=Streptomyces sp. 3211.6 TaxID=1938845 RepID=UPI0011E606C0|nr:hypothetical protein [Streptomyces sp. 3211.6]
MTASDLARALCPPGTEAQAAFDGRPATRVVIGTHINLRTWRLFPVRDQTAVNGLRAACALKPLPVTPTDSGLILRYAAQHFVAARTGIPC